MDPSLFLTVFLLIGGAFTFWCAFKNYDWYFNFPGFPKVFVDGVGRPAARIFYIAMSLLLLVWGAVRIASPPEVIPTDFIYELASPAEIDLTENGAVDQLMGLGEVVTDLVVENGDWTSFWIEVDPDDPSFPLAAAAAVAGPDFHEGFTFGPKALGKKGLAGVVIYFDADHRSCNNILFSSRPIRSAHFAMVICDRGTSISNGFTEGLGLFFCRAGTPFYEDAIR